MFFRLFILLLTINMISGCALFSDGKKEFRRPSPQVKIFYDDFSNVWRAAQLSLQNYPVRINNMDKGILETEPISTNSKRAWHPPHLKKSKASAGLSYSLHLVASKGDVEGSHAVRVSVRKKMKMKNDFFSGYKSIASDGLEELSILYRIQRELVIDRALNRAADRNSQ